MIIAIASVMYIHGNVIEAMTSIILGVAVRSCENARPVRSGYIVSAP